MNLGNEVKKKKETQILGRFGRKKLVVYKHENFDISFVAVFTAFFF